MATGLEGLAAAFYSCREIQAAKRPVAWNRPQPQERPCPCRSLVRPQQRTPASEPQAAGPAPRLQWTATSRGSWNLTRLEVLCGSAPRPRRSGRLRLRIEGGHFLSPSWAGVASRGRGNESPPLWRLETSCSARVPAASCGFFSQTPLGGPDGERRPPQTCAWPPCTPRPAQGRPWSDGCEPCQRSRGQGQ